MGIRIWEPSCLQESCGWSSQSSFSINATWQNRQMALQLSRVSMLHGPANTILCYSIWSKVQAEHWDSTQDKQRWLIYHLHTLHTAAQVRSTHLKSWDRTTDIAKIFDGETEIMGPYLIKIITLEWKDYYIYRPKTNIITHSTSSNLINIRLTELGFVLFCIG